MLLIPVATSKIESTMPACCLTRLCYACGKPIGGGYKHCPKCNIYFCWYCGYLLQNQSKEYPIKYPMCSGDFK